MRARASALLLSITASLGTACWGENPFHDAENETPPCVPAFSPGQRLTVGLDSVYDASSDYFYDGSFASSGWNAMGGCADEDGLGVESVVTFALERETVGVFEAACHPYLARFSPEVVSEPRLVVSHASSVPERSIAAAFAQGTLDGREVLVIRELIAPSGDPFGELVPRELPPLVVKRTIVASEGSSACSDMWVVRWEEAP